MPTRCCGLAALRSAGDGKIGLDDLGREVAVTLKEGCINRNGAIDDGFGYVCSGGGASLWNPTVHRSTRDGVKRR